MNHMQTSHTTTRDVTIEGSLKYQEYADLKPSGHSALKRRWRTQDTSHYVPAALVRSIRSVAADDKIHMCVATNIGGRECYVVLSDMPNHRRHR